MISDYKELAAKVAELENAVGKHDDAIKAIVRALQQMIVPPDGSGKSAFKISGGMALCADDRGGA